MANSGGVRRVDNGESTEDQKLDRREPIFFKQEEREKRDHSKFDRLGLRSREREEGEYNHWAIEPGVDRLANGIPSKLDCMKLKAYGNAVSPQRAYPIFKAIHNIQNMREAE